jgi:hypothetical protein
MTDDTETPTEGQLERDLLAAARERTYSALIVLLDNGGATPSNGSAGRAVCGPTPVRGWTEGSIPSRQTGSCATWDPVAIWLWGDLWQSPNAWRSARQTF